MSSLGTATYVAEFRITPCPGYAPFRSIPGWLRQRLEISVSPAVADAQNFPTGIVQFTATGSTSPTWCVGSANGMCNGNIVSPATVDANGRAQCVPGRSGTVTILAGTGRRVTNPDGSSQLAHFGFAQLTCP